MKTNYSLTKTLRRLLAVSLLALLAGACSSGGDDDDAPPENTQGTGNSSGGSAPAQSNPKINFSLVSSTPTGTGDFNIIVAMNGSNIAKGTFASFALEGDVFLGPDSKTVGSNGLVNITLSGTVSPGQKAKAITYLQRDTTGDGAYDEVKGPYTKSFTF